LPALVFMVVTASREVQEDVALEASAQDTAQGHGLDDSFDGIKLVSNGDNICGGVRIWGLLTEGIVDPDAVKNIDWPRIEAEEQKYLDTAGARRAQCQHELDGLQKRLQAKLEDVLPGTTKDEVEPMINYGLRNFGEHGALAFKCGATRRFVSSTGARVKLTSADPYAESVAAFDRAAQAFFALKEARLDGDLFETTCHAKLQVQRTDAEAGTYCNQLCQAFRSAAQKASNTFVGPHALGIDELKDQIREKEECVRTAKEGMDACLSDSKSLEVFKSQLVKLAEDIDTRFADVRSARGALADARDQLDDLEDDLDEQGRALEDAIEKLADAGGEAKGAEAALAEAKAKENSLKEAVASASSELGSLSAELKDVERASNLVSKLKTTVEAVMELMDGFAEAALREPVRRVGFDNFPDDMAFPDPVEATQAAGDAKTSISAVRDYCDGTALPAFAALKESSSIDLGPLCEFEEPEAVFEDLSVQVKMRQNLVKEDMEKVSSWLTPYKFRQMLSKQAFDAAAEEDADLVSKGQAAGLEKVKSIYMGRSSFYKYLINWRLNGPFSELIDKLKGRSDELNEAVESAKKNLAALQASLMAAQKELQTAIDKLAEATGKVDAAAENKAQLEADVESLEKQSRTMANNIEELEGALSKAYAALEKAKESLVTSHAQGTDTALLEVKNRGARVQPRLQLEAQ